MSKSHIKKYESKLVLNSAMNNTQIEKIMKSFSIKKVVWINEKLHIHLLSLSNILLLNFSTLHFE